MGLRDLAILICAVLAGCASAVPAPLPSSAPAPPNRLLEDVRILSADDMEGRLVGTQGSAKARRYLIGRLEELELEPVRPGFEQPFTFSDKGRLTTGVNLLGRIEGTSRSKRVLLVMAHYDHMGVVDGQIFNGADDNASGAAALLAVAAALREHPPEHDVIFALVDGEEGGQRGSNVLAADPPVPLASIALVVNFDMVSKSDKGELYAAGAFHFPFLKPRLEALATGAPVSLKLGHDSAEWGESQDWTAESDHFPFHGRGVPWVYFGVEDHPEYHQPTDDFATVPQDFFRRSAQTVTAAVRAFDADLDAIAREAGR